MRHPVILFLPLLALAACGRPGLDKADGSFDRAAFGERYTRECVEGMRATAASVPEASAASICGCLTGQLIATSSDDELRSWYRDDRVPVAKIQQITEQCRHLGPGGAPSSGLEDVPPPPEEPPPSMADGTPPPVVAPGDGPAPGGGATVPGVRARARANLASYLSSGDYPAAALRNNEQGQVVFALDIGPDGRVAGCRITQSSGSAALDSTTCRIMRSRARFTPARDARGAAVADRSSASVTWRLPSG